VGRWPRYVIRKRKVSFPREALGGAYGALEEDLSPGGVDRADGLRMTWREDGTWLHVRPSGTEPVVRLIAEAPTEEKVDALLGRAEEILLGLA
jgi:phosphomannomutase